jgi:hypothetical protein
MNWIDIRVRKPTKADADKFCRVLVAFGDESIGVHDWGWIATKSTSCIAWMPLSDLPKFVPIPDPPEGYRFKQVGDERTSDALRWSLVCEAWMRVSEFGEFTPGEIYAVPIAPPKPQYRPFSIAAEWLPHKDRDVVNADKQFQRWMTYTNFCIRFPSGLYTWEHAFKVLKFADGTPFGLPV